MSLFDPRTKHLSDDHGRIYALYEIAFTVVDVMAALLFVVGSILFFDESTVEIGTWLFLIGSVFFGLKPTIRLLREWHMLRAGRLEDLAERAEG